MYLPPAFREDDLRAQHELIEAYPLGLVITAGPGGLLANHIPCALHSDGPRGTLRFHLSRANAQVEALRLAQEVLVAFQGPDGYITPGWYAAKAETGKVVPTWNYVAVHAWGEPAVIDDTAWLLRHLEDLTGRHEQTQSHPWKVSDAPDSFIAAQLKGIVGVELPIGRIEGKWKVSQNRSAADRRAVADGLALQGGTSASLAEMVRERSRRITDQEGPSR